MIVFDLDGTLVDSHPAIHASVVHTLGVHGIAVDEARLREAMSRPLRDLFAHVTRSSDAATIDRLGETYLAHYVVTMIERSPPFPGIVAMLDRLLALGLPLTVLTNKTEINGRRIAEAHFGEHRFRAIVGSVPGRENKPSPEGALFTAARLGVEAADAWLVGDSPIDVATARNAGMTSVAATWSLDADAQATVADADHRASTPEALVELVLAALEPDA